MKKLLVLLCASLMFTTPVFAENKSYQDKVKFGVRYDDSSVSSKDQVNVRIDLDREWDNGFKLGYGSRSNHRFEGDRNTQRHMLRIGQEFGNFVLNGQVGVKLPHGKEHSYFWTIQPGYKFKLTNDLQLRVSYDYREGFSGNGVSGKENDYRYGPRLRLKHKVKWSFADAIELHIDRFTFKDDETRNRIGLVLEKKF
jgi:opacity protein-like surface antigen